MLVYHESLHPTSIRLECSHWLCAWLRSVDPFAPLLFLFQSFSAPQFAGTSFETPMDCIDSMDVPKDGDTILVLQREWLDQILDLSKIMEIRNKNFQAKRYWLGCGQIIYGRARTRQSVPITNQNQWKDLRSQHRVPDEASKYDRDSPPEQWTKTFGLPLEDVRRVSPVRYVHPRGAIGIVIYHPIIAEAETPGGEACSSVGSEPMAAETATVSKKQPVIGKTKMASKLCRKLRRQNAMSCPSDGHLH